MPRLLIVLCIILAGCGAAPVAPTATLVPPPTPAPVPTTAPTPNIQATVAVAVAATQAAQPTATRPVPTATTAPAPTVKLEATQSKYRPNPGQGTIAVYGLVENKGDAPVISIQVAVSLLGDTGATVGVAHAYLKPFILEPGEQWPWAALIDGTPAFKAIRVQVQAEPMPPSRSAAPAREYRDLTLEGVTVAPPGPPYNFPKISGQVMNSGSRVAESASIVLVAYDDDGSILLVDDTTAKLDTIAPGQSAPFEFDFQGRDAVKGKPIGKHELFIRGNAKL